MKRKVLNKELTAKIKEIESHSLSLQNKLKLNDLLTRIFYECKVNKVLISGMIQGTMIDYCYEGWNLGRFYYTDYGKDGFVILGDRLKDIDIMADFMFALIESNSQITLREHSKPVNLEIVGNQFRCKDNTYAVESLWYKPESSGEMLYKCRIISRSKDTLNEVIAECFSEDEILKQIKLSDNPAIKAFQDVKQSMINLSKCKLY